MYLSVVTELFTNAYTLSGDTFPLDGINDTTVQIKKAKGSKCERCWIIAHEVKASKQHLCNRCNGVINEISK